MSYMNDRAWSDAFIPEIRRLVGPYLLVPAPFEIDTREAADLIVLRARDMTIAARVRRPGYASRFPWDITLRARRDSGVKTEFSKIIEGWGDWFFYGHNSRGADIDRWFLIDLHELRAGLIRGGNLRRRAQNVQSNGDGTHFVAFDVRELPRAIVASSHQIEKAAMCSAQEQLGW